VIPEIKIGINNNTGDLGIPNFTKKIGKNIKKTK
jgi:hypothetical protein